MKRYIYLLLIASPLMAGAQSGNDQPELAEYNLRIAQDPADYKAYYERSVVRYRQGDFDGACDDVFQGLGLLGKSTADPDLSAKLKNRAGDYCDPTQPGYDYRRGMSFYALRQYEKSIAAFQQGLEKFPRDPWLLVAMADVCFAAGQYQSAVQYNEKALAIQELPAPYRDADGPVSTATETLNWTLVDFRASVNVHIALAYLGLGEPEMALARMNQSISTAKTTRSYGLENEYLVRGHIYLSLGKNDAARQDFTQCIKLDPTFEAAYVGRALAEILSEPVQFSGFALADSLGMTAHGVLWELPVEPKREKAIAGLQTALQDCEKAIALQPADGYAYFVRGQIRKMLDEPGHCSDFYKAIEMDYLVEVAFFHDCGVSKQ